jgi:hypothetical protein
MVRVHPHGDGALEVVMVKAYLQAIAAMTRYLAALVTGRAPK